MYKVAVHFFSISPLTLSIPGIPERIPNPIFTRNTRYFHKYYHFLLQIIFWGTNYYSTDSNKETILMVFLSNVMLLWRSDLKLGLQCSNFKFRALFGPQRRSINTWLLVDREGTIPLKWKADFKWLLAPVEQSPPPWEFQPREMISSVVAIYRWGSWDPISFLQRFNFRLGFCISH